MNVARPETWLSPREAAAELGVSPKSVYKAIRLNRLKAAQVNDKDLRIARSWLLAFLERRCRRASPRR